MCESKEKLEASLTSLVSSLDPESMHGLDAKSLVSYFSRLEHLAVAGKALCARRVASTGVYELDGHRDPGSWLAGETGDSLGAALSILRTAENIAGLAEIEDAFRSGELSGAQARELAETAKLDPSRQKELLDAAKDEDLPGLKRRCERVRAERRREQDEQAREADVHEKRSVRTFVDREGVFRLEARLTKASGARLLAALEAEGKSVFADARRSGAIESSRAYLADALMNLVCGQSDQSRKAVCHLRVDVTALRRGSLAPGEVCEIAGVGPVSIANAKELLGDSIVKLLVTSATDVHSVINLGRAVPASVYTALLERDPCCVVPGCSSTRNLQVDHRVVPYVEAGPVSLANCSRICQFHHHLKTNRGYALEGESGAWVWVHPDGTRHGQTQAEQTQAEQTQAEQTQAGQTQAGQTQGGQAQAEQCQAEQCQAEQALPEQAQLEISGPPDHLDEAVGPRPPPGTGSSPGSQSTLFMADAAKDYVIAVA